MKIKFCLLEKDEKTFNYTKEYLKVLEKRENNCLRLDNEIQKKEIEQHLERKGKHISPEDERNKEAFLWIDNYACNFRVYLNTIKIAASFLHYKNINSNDLTKEEFEHCCDAVNELRDFLMENIFY